MEKVYLVYYDNGQTWEDHHVYVDKIFSSKESADKYVEEKNAPIQEYTPSITEERYISENWAEDTGYTYAGFGYTYAGFIENEQYDWSMHRDSKYYVSESDVHP